MSSVDLIAALGTVPIWLIITTLVGVINGSVFFLLAGRRPFSLFVYLPCACLAASIIQAAGVFEAGAVPFSLGDVQLVAASMTAWATLALARAAGH
jgi:hypothetical protein